MMARKSFYAVARGRKIGIYDSWVDCKQSVNGYAGAIFKKFGTEREAKRFIENHQNAESPSVTNVAKMRPLEQRTAETRSKCSKEVFYAVKSSNPSIPNRIFQDWDSCSAFVRGKRGLAFRKFFSCSEATKYVAGSLNPQLLAQRLDTTLRDFDQRYTLQANEDSPLNAELRAKTISVFCDGSSIGNGKATAAAGYGVYFEDFPDFGDISEPLTNGEATNNRAELKAVLEALLKIWKSIKQKTPVPLFHIFSDSELVVKLINDDSTVLTDQELRSRINGDLLVPLLHVYQKVQRFYYINEHFYKDPLSNESRQLSITWIKGHAGYAGNEIADRLARSGAEKLSTSSKAA